MAFVPFTPFNTSAVVADSDGDGLNDSAEVFVYFTRPDHWDTDNDTLSDYDEVEFHKTSPIKSDTDGDGLNDSSELTAALVNGYSGEYNPIYDTNATNWDTDNDSLPDGAEFFYYGTNATDPDSESTLILGAEADNEIRDGDEFDSDHDGLSDGKEYDYKTTEVYDGGPFNPDSDHDGIPDGLEVYYYKTDPALWDTDNDTFSDGLEILLGTDPLDNSTTSETIFDALDRINQNHGIVVIAPEGGGGGSMVANTFRPTVLNSTNISHMSFRIDLNPIQSPMAYNARFGVWEGPVISLEDGKHTLTVEAIDEDGTVYRRTVTFRFGDKPEWIDFGQIPIFAFLGILSLLSAALVFGGAQMLSNLMMRKGKGGRQL